jgi:hypothetical protein
MRRWFLAAVGLGCALAFAFLLYRAFPRPAGTPTDAGPFWFQDVTAEAGIDFVHDCGPIDDRYFLPQHLGSGCALFDFDGDGLLDVLLLNAGGPRGRPNVLLQQRPDGTFLDVSAGSGLDYSAYCMGAAVGDFDNDGRPDLLITEYGRVRLFRNLGGGKFQDVSEAAGVRNPAWAVSASFFDFDRDGLLDLVIVNYVDYDPTRSCVRDSATREFCGPQVFRGTPARLLRNLGGGKFQDVSFESGLGRKAGPGYASLCADLDGDGWPDVFVTNDAAPNHLWINQRDGTFKEEAAARGAAVNRTGRAEANMGIAWGDADGDGLQDLFVTHLHTETHTLWRQGPRGFFQDRTAEARLQLPAWRGTGFGTVLADFDHDGALDLALVNGKVFRDAPAPAGADDLHPFWRPYAQRNQLFRNRGGGAFDDVSGRESGPGGFCRQPGVWRALATGDVRNEGALWLLATAVGGPARLYKNVAPDRGNWLVVRAYDAARKRDALGAEVTVTAGGRRWVRTAHADGSFACSSDPRAHFGLGSVQRIDHVDVVWPHDLEGRRKERFEGGPVNRHRVLEQGRGKPLE